MAYEVNRKRGKLGVDFGCPHCGDQLRCPIEEAGTSQQCPTCGRAVDVPGKEERDRIDAEEAAAADRNAQLQREAELRRAELEAGRVRDRVRDEAAAAERAVVSAGRPTGYKDIVSGADLLRGFGTFTFCVGGLCIAASLVVGFVVMATNGPMAFLVALAGTMYGVAFLIIGAILKMFAGLCMAVRDVAVNTHAIAYPSTETPSAPDPIPASP